MYGKLEIKDGKSPKVECNPEKIDWNQDPPYCPVETTWSARPWGDKDQIRVTMEFGQIGKQNYQKQREQLRFIRHVDEDKWDDIVQSIKDFNIWDDDTKKEFYKFTTIPENDYDRLDQSGTVGFKVIGNGAIDQAARTTMVEFIRPFDVSRDDALTIEGGQKYQLWLQWGVFDN